VHVHLFARFAGPQSVGFCVQPTALLQKPQQLPHVQDCHQQDEGLHWGDDWRQGVLRDPLVVHTPARTATSRQRPAPEG